LAGFCFSWDQFGVLISTSQLFFCYSRKGGNPIKYLTGLFEVTPLGATVAITAGKIRQKY
jgi:hypothetical protein